MTRIEAFEALFGADANRTASKGAWETIKSDPRPSKTEEGQLSVDTLDKACDFVDRPAFYAGNLPDGNIKTVLTAVAAELASAASAPAVPLAVPPVAPLPVVPAPAPPAPAPATRAAPPGVIADPLANLLAAGHGTAAPPAAGRVTVAPPGARRSSQDGEDDSSDDSDTHRRRKKGKKEHRKDDEGGDDDSRREPPLPTPPKPLSSITREVREAVVERDPNWPQMRDAIVAAFRANDAGKLERARTVMQLKLDGQHGEEGRLFGAAMRSLFTDLRANLHVSDAQEFRRRYWYP